MKGLCNRWGKTCTATWTLYGFTLPPRPHPRSATFSPPSLPRSSSGRPSRTTRCCERSGCQTFQCIPSWSPLTIDRRRRTKARRIQQRKGGPTMDRSSRINNTNSTNTVYNIHYALGMDLPTSLKSLSTRWGRENEASGRLQWRQPHDWLRGRS